MKPEWRLLDTGVRTGAENMALDQTCVEVRGRGLSPNTVRFLQFSPPVALVGAYQDVEQEIRVDYCRESGIDINRRITGGGGLLFDEIQLGWELIAGLRDFDINPFSQKFQQRICDAAITGLKELGIEANFRPRNDIEVNGRKICGTGGVEDGEAFLFQGTLLIDFDVASMIKALRIPTEKLKQSSLASAEDRVTWIKKELGYLPPMDEIKAAVARGFEKVFDARLVPAGLNAEEEATFARLLPEFQSDLHIYGKRRRPSFVNTFHGLCRTDNAVIRAHISVDTRQKRLRQALITGDMFITPKRTLLDLEARLKDMRLDLSEIKEAVTEFWSETRPVTSGFDAEDVFEAVRDAVMKTAFLDKDFNADEISRLMIVNGTPDEILEKDVSVVLLPYCAKLPDCTYRYEEGCVKCGQCSVGEGFELAESFGMKPITIVSFEHLMETLQRLKREGVEAYVGSCCEAFFNKHYHDFRVSGMPGILVDVCHATCYDLNKVQEAYAGEFENQTDLHPALLRKVIETAARVRVARTSTE